MRELTAQEYYRRLLLIRRFEERLLELFSRGELSGTTHCYIGQEAIAVGVISNLLEQDVIFSSHRCHGHYLARTENAVGLFAEIMGKPNGICGGRGGSQHLCDRNFYTNGVQGSFSPITVGIAFGEKRKRSAAVVVAFLGDGTLGEGAAYEAFNMASLYGVPLLFVVENNLYAQTTSISDNLAGSITARFEAFGIETSETSSQDVVEIATIARQVIDRVRESQRPAALVCNTYRFCAHSKGDDFRGEEELATYREADPLKIAAARVPANERSEIEAGIHGKLHAAEQEAREGVA